MMEHGIASSIPRQAVHHSIVPVCASLDGGAVKLVIAAFDDAACWRIAHSFGKAERADRFKTYLGARACRKEEQEAGSDRLCLLSDQARQPSGCLTGATKPNAVFCPASYREHENAPGHPEECTHSYQSQSTQSNQYAGHRNHKEKKDLRWQRLSPEGDAGCDSRLLLL